MYEVKVNRWEEEWEGKEVGKVYRRKEGGIDTQMELVRGMMCLDERGRNGKAVDYSLHFPSSHLFPS